MGIVKKAMLEELWEEQKEEEQEQQMYEVRNTSPCHCDFSKNRKRMTCTTSLQSSNTLPVLSKVVMTRRCVSFPPFEQP